MHLEMTSAKCLPFCLLKRSVYISVSRTTYVSRLNWVNKFEKLITVGYMLSLKPFRGHGNIALKWHGYLAWQLSPIKPDKHKYSSLFPRDYQCCRQTMPAICHVLIGRSVGPEKISDHSQEVGLAHGAREWNDRRFTDDIFKWIFLHETCFILINISVKVVPQVPINNVPSLVQIMAWHRTGDKPLSEPMLT